MARRTSSFFAEKRMVGSFGYIARHPELTLIGFILGETTTTE